MRQLLIGLWGPAGVGKDSIADALGYPKASFAAMLKQALAPIFTDMGIDITDRKQKEKVRPLMVALGSVARSIDPNYWVKRVKIPNSPIVTFSDVRYWNEILSILFRGGVVYQITRDGFAPANDEEQRSFAEIERRLADLGVDIPRVVNSTPDEAAVTIEQDLYHRAAQIVENV